MPKEDWDKFQLPPLFQEKTEVYCRNAYVRSFKYYLGRVKPNVTTYYMKTYRKKQTQKRNLLFTIISRGFMTPVHTANIFKIIFTVFGCVPITTVISLYGLHLIAAPSTVK